MAGSVCTLIEIGMRQKVGQVGFLVFKLSISWGVGVGRAVQARPMRKKMTL